MNYDVIVIKKNFMKPVITLKGNIIKENSYNCPDWMGMDFIEKHTTILLENGKTIELVDEGYGATGKYSFKKIKP